MNSGNNNDLEFWEIQVSIARAAARLPKPSLAKFHYEVLEEIGKPPGLDLIDYFVQLTNIADEEVDEYFRFIGKTKEGPKKEKNRDPQKELAKRCTGGDSPSVLKFRQAFLEEFNEPPPEELIGYFLQLVQGTATGKDKSNDKQAQLNLAESIACSTHPTVAKLRNGFQEQFGTLPSNEIVQHFLEKMRQYAQVKKLPDEEYESKVNFAKTVAGGLVSTILQFRKAFEKAYGEPPAPEITEIFIRHLPRKNKKPESE
ncbi:MAG TPA: hypothetical protein ENK84_05570 [Desulfobulbus sp.]|nr:hypothetical protein [Desulfobulbus sp.]